MNFSVDILGCQYNYYDAKNITHQMQKMGYVFIKDYKKSDVVFIVSCAVRQKPIDRVVGKIEYLKNQHPQTQVIVTGCLLKNDLKKITDKKAIFIESNKIQSFIADYFKKIENVESVKEMYFTSSDAALGTAYVPIMQGCNNFCTYCAVPYTRGREVSRRIDDVIVEVQAEIKKGMKHIVLLGQNVNRYCITVSELQERKELSGEYTDHFTILLSMIDRLNGKFDYNFISANPNSFSRDLIKFLPQADKWNRHLHLPLQSGNDDILKKMNRKYTVKDYLEIIKSLKLKIKKLKLTTDIIVGFPNETKSQFDDTLKLCEKIDFDSAFISQYSPRPQTVAYTSFTDNVTRSEKKRRWSKLNKLINKK